MSRGAGHPLPASGTVRVTAGTGRVVVRATDRADVLVRRGEVTEAGDERNPLTVAAADRVQLEVPEGTHLVIGAASGRVEVGGRVGRVAVSAGSGRVVVDHADEIDIRGDSGRVEIGSCGGRCRVVNRSGRTTIRSTGPADVVVDTGRIEIDKAHGAVRAKTVAGRILVTLATPSDVQAESVAGSITIRVPRKIRPSVILRSEWGRVDIDVKQGEDCTITAESVRGRLAVQPLGT